MTHPRQRPRFALTQEEQVQLQEVSASDYETPRRRERADILLAYASGMTISGLVRQFKCSRNKVHRCIDRALEKGIVASLSDRQRRGRPPNITPEAQRWLVSFTDKSPKELGYSSEWWTTDLLAKHARSNCHEHGHSTLATVSQSTVSKLLRRFRITLHVEQVFYEGEVRPVHQAERRKPPPRQG